MIESIGIINYQSHKESFVKFCKGFNVIVGASDAGKSVIIRALRWVIRNRPMGDDVKNWDAGKKDPVTVEVSLINPDGRSISVTKERKGMTAFYETSDGQKLEAVDKDAPKEISDIFNLSEFNMQSQHDPYFMLNDSGGKVAETLNKLVGLSAIGTSLKNLNSDALALKREISADSAALEATIKQIDELNYIDDLAAKIAIAEQSQKEMEETRERLLKIQNILERIKLATEARNNSIGKLSAKSLADKLLATLKQIEETKNKLSAIVPVIKNIEIAKLEIANEKTWLQIRKPFAQLKDTIAEIDSTKKQIRRIETIRESIARARSEKDRHKKSAEFIRSQLKKFLNDHKICPFCSHPFDKKDIERIAQQ